MSYPVNPLATARAIPTMLIACVASAALGISAAHQLLAGSKAVAAAYLVYLLGAAIVWQLTRGNAVILVLGAYLLGPAAADNLLPQVALYPESDFTLRTHDAFLLADVILLAVLLTLRPPLPRNTLVRLWMGGLVLLAAYPVAIGMWAGEGQSLAASLAGAVMPLRGAVVVWLISVWVARCGWESTLRDATRTVAVAGGVLGAAVIGVALATVGHSDFSLFSFALVTDGRISIPGWGNNILANFLCVATVTTVYCGRALRWKLPWILGVLALTLTGVTLTQVRIATLVAFALAEVVLVWWVARWLWQRRQRMRSVLAGGLTAVLLGSLTVTALAAVNPRFETLTPAVILEQLTSDGGPETDKTATPERESYDEESETELGSESASTRTKLTKAGLELWESSPLWGIGWNGWGWGKSELEVMPPAPLVPLVVAIDPHNGLLWLLMEAGIIGVLLVYALPVFAAWRQRAQWWVWMVPAVATLLDVVNANLRNGHFSSVVWAFTALGMLAFMADSPSRRSRVLFVVGSNVQLDSAQRVSAELTRGSVGLDIWEARVQSLDTITFAGHMAPVTLSRIRSVGRAASQWARENPGGVVVVPQDVGLVYRRAIAAARSNGATIVLLPDGAVSSQKVTGRSMLGGLVPVADAVLRSSGLIAGAHGRMGWSKPDVALSWGPAWSETLHTAGARRVINAGNPRSDDLAGLSPPTSGKILICSQPMDHAAIGGQPAAEKWYAFLDRLVQDAPPDALKIRLHPAEANKIDELRLTDAVRATLTSDTSLSEDIAWSGAVISWASTTMMEAAGARRAVVSLAVNSAAAEMAQGYFFQRDKRVVSALTDEVASFAALEQLVDAARQQQQGLTDEYLVNVGSAARTAAEAIDAA